VAVCEVCGNEYDKLCQVWRNGRLMKFDRVECAMQVMRPARTGCGVHIMGSAPRCSVAGAALINKAVHDDQACAKSHNDN
jgi:hypothetical protein